MRGSHFCFIVLVALSLGARARADDETLRSRLAALGTIADAEVDRSIATVRHAMEASAEPAVKLSVPIQVDAKAALNWEAAH